MVSIPFERESISKVDYINRMPRMTEKFQFPSSGKVYPKVERYGPYTVHFVCVSIPFERESISKAVVLTEFWNHTNLSFNSLRAGKYIQRRNQRQIGGSHGRVSIPFERESISKES